MTDTLKHIKAVISTPIDNKINAGLSDPPAYWHHHIGNGNLCIVLCICITLIFICIIVGGFLLRWQRNKHAAETAERCENFGNQKAMEDRYTQAATERETSIKEDEDLRKTREFVISLIEKLKLKNETTILTPDLKKQPEAKTEKKEMIETINEEFLKQLIEKIKGISF